MKATIRIILASLLGIHAATSQSLSFLNSGTIPTTEITPLFRFANTRPICVVLIHGITGFPSSATTTPAPGTLRHARYYWQPEFVRGLMGLTSEDPVSFTPPSEPDPYYLRRSNWETEFCRSNVSSDHLMSATGRPDPGRKFYPFLSVMFTHRDGSKHLASQSVDTATQIRNLYRDNFGSWPPEKQPQLILMCHSGGGLVARTICTVPTSLGGGTSGTFPNIRQIPNRIFTAAERANMDFIRNRTMYIVTISTPHEGAQVAQVANQIGQNYQFVPQIAEQDPDAPILGELTLHKMRSYNQNQLHPSLCRRGDGTAVPLYCIGGRAPGGPEYYANPNQHDGDWATPDGGIPFTKEQIKEVNASRSNRREFEAHGLMNADYATQTIWATALINGNRIPGSPEFGNPADPGSILAYGRTPANNPGLDIVRTVELNLLGGLSAPSINMLTVGNARLFYLRDNWVPITRTIAGVPMPTGQFVNLGPSTTGDGIIDCDGFVPINSALGAKLGTTSTNPFAHTSTGGSWYRFYRSAADYHNHGSVTRSEPIGRWLRENITGCHIGNQLAHYVRTDIAAGPRVRTTGRVSGW